jgi:Zn-dependent alcohol dehydrogenase
MRIRAAVLEEFAKPLVVQEVELAEPGPGEVLVCLGERGRGAAAGVTVDPG